MRWVQRPVHWGIGIWVWLRGGIPIWGHWGPPTWRVALADDLGRCGWWCDWGRRVGGLKRRYWCEGHWSWCHRGWLYRWHWGEWSRLGQRPRWYIGWSWLGCTRYWRLQGGSSLLGC